MLNGTEQDAEMMTGRGRDGWDSGCAFRRWPHGRSKKKPREISWLGKVAIKWSY